MSRLHHTVRRVAKRFGLQPVNDDEEWTVYWTDTSVLLERVMEMKRYQVEKYLDHQSQQGGEIPWDSNWNTDCAVSVTQTFINNIIYYCVFLFVQKINHFPGMIEICRKDLLARNMNRMLKLFPKDYNCFPRSWCMPAEYVTTHINYYQRGRESSLCCCTTNSYCLVACT